ncbi:MAG: MFS transporter [Spirochaetota bacterium]
MAAPAGTRQESERRPARASSGVSGLIALLAGAHFAHHVLTALLAPLLPFIRDEFTLSYAQSGVVTSAFTVAYGVAQLPAGWLSDKVGPRYLLLVGITGVAGAGALVGLSPTFALLLGALVLLGVAGGGYHPASSAVISRFVAPARRGRALGVHIIGGSSSHFLAPLIAAGMVSLVGWRGSFLTLSLPVAILGVVLFVLIQRRIHRADTFVRSQAARDESARAAAEADVTSTGSSGADLTGDTVEHSSASPRRYGAARMTFFLILTGFVSAGIASVIPFIPLYLTDVRGVDDRLAAGFISIIFGAGFFAAPLGGWLSDVFGRVRVMVVLAVLTGPMIALILVSPFPSTLAAVLLFIGVLMFTKMPTAEAHIASEVSERHRTTILGVYFFSGMEGSAILTPILGAVIDRWGFDVGFASVGGGLLLVAMLCTLALFVLNLVSRRPHA